MNSNNVKKMLIVEKYTSFEYSEKKGNINKISQKRLEELKKSHQIHNLAKEFVLNLLNKKEIEYVLIKDDEISLVKYSNFNLVMSLGGDGTALHAMSYIENQIFFGVNTDPLKSLGKLTKLNIENLEKALDNYLINQNNFEYINRLSAKINGISLSSFAVNEILIADPRIYKTTHLEIEIEESKLSTISNGIIISTSQGSSAFYKSSGAKEFHNKNLTGYNIIMPFTLNGTLKQTGKINKKTSIIIKPKREHAKIIFDCHEKRSFDLHQGDIVEILTLEKNKIKVVI